MGIESWSTTASNNNAAPPNGWPEGQAPSTVNDCARQMMAYIRSWYNDAQWTDWGDSTVYASGTSFTIAGMDVTTRYTVGRRVRAVGSSTGTIYGIITVSAFSTNTTVTVAWDSGSLSNEALTMSLGILNPLQFPLPPYTDTYPVVCGSSDKTKKVRFEADGITTGTTRVVTIPDSNGTLAYTEVFPKFSVTRGGSNQASITNGYNKIQFNTEVYDTNNNFDSSTNYRFTPTVAGKYLFTLAVTLTAINADRSTYAAIYKNGSIDKQAGVSSSGAVANPGFVSCILDMNGSSDYVEAYIFNGDPATQTIDGVAANTWFMGARLP